jgi:sugar lactone lactonase YvrE
MEMNWKKIVPSDTVQLRDPRAISLSREGLLYIADTGHHRVIAVDSTGKLVAETGGFGNAHGQFQWPQDIRADFGNMVWVVDYGNRRIETFSRSLVYQGTLEIKVTGDETRHQPEVIALSPQGDLYAFDRDGGRLLCYDPLYNLRAEFGGRSGGSFLTDVARMAFIPSRGLVWWVRGESVLHRSDLLLNPVDSYSLPVADANLALAVADTGIIVGSMSGVWRVHLNRTSPDSLLSAAQLDDIGLRQLDAMAWVKGVLFLLDGKAGTLFRITLQQN